MQSVDSTSHDKLVSELQVGGLTSVETSRRPEEMQFWRVFSVEDNFEESESESFQRGWREP